MVERIHGKDEVSGSIPEGGSILLRFLPEPSNFAEMDPYFLFLQLCRNGFSKHPTGGFSEANEGFLGAREGESIPEGGSILLRFLPEPSNFAEMDPSYFCNFAEMDPYFFLATSREP